MTEKATYMGDTFFRQLMPPSGGLNCAVSISCLIAVVCGLVTVSSSGCVACICRSCLGLFVKSGVVGLVDSGVSHGGLAVCSVRCAFCC